MSEAAPASVPEGGVRMSRRNFLKGGLLGVCLIGAGVASDKFYEEFKRSMQREHEEYEAALKFAKQFKEGVSGEWVLANVWPGVAIIPSDTKLFSTPSLNEQTTINWPSDKTADHLLAQRPFMVQATAQLNTLKADLSIGSQVLGFWLPGSNQLAYCNRIKSGSDIVLPTSVMALSSIYEDNYSRITGEKTILQPAASSHGLVWRYLDAERINEQADYGLPADKRLETKVVGRSVWADPALAAEAYYAFQTTEGNDVVQLPAGVHK
jgi:hypothetical protein